MDHVILAQTDTTVGFLSQNASRLSQIKERPTHKPFIKSFDSLRRYQTMGGRVPQAFKNRIRRTKNTTFVINNQAVRIVADAEHHKLLQKYGWLYSTSANEQSLNFTLDFAIKESNFIVEDERGLFEGSSSNIYKVNAQKIKQLR